MASWNQEWSNIENPYVNDPCPYCGGPHYFQDCQIVSGNELCAPSQSFEWNLCYECGGQDGHWNGCPNIPYFSPNDFCDGANDAYEFDRSNANMELEPEWQGIQERFQEDMDLSISQEECTQYGRCEYLMERILENQMEYTETFKGIKEGVHQNELALQHLRERMNQLIEVANAQEVRDVSNFQEELSLKDVLECQERIVEEEHIWDEEEIVSRRWLRDQAQKLKVHEARLHDLNIVGWDLEHERGKLRDKVNQFDLEARILKILVHEMVEASKAQHEEIVINMLEMGEFVEESASQIMETHGIDHILKLLDDDAIGKEVVLESSADMKNSCDEDSSTFEEEHVRLGVQLVLKRVGPHSLHFSTLCVDEAIETEEQSPLDDFGIDERNGYIVEFVTPRRQNDIPHLKAKKCKMKYSVFEILKFAPPSREHDRKLDSKLGKQFIFSKWREK